MAARVGQSRHAPRLLKTVLGLPHATPQDHEPAQQTDDAPQEQTPPRGSETRGMDDVNANPLSSSDENEALRIPKPSKPAKPFKSAPEPDILRLPPSSTRKRKADSTPPLAEPGLRTPERTASRASKRKVAPRPPKTGQFGQSQAAKAHHNGNKENATSTQTPPSSSLDTWGFGIFSQPEQSGPKKLFGGKKAGNIHTAPSSAKTKASRPVKYGTVANKKKIQVEDPGSESDVSILDDDDSNNKVKKSEFPEPQQVKSKKVVARTEAEVAPLREEELDELLKPTPLDYLDLTSDTPNSSLPESSTSQQEINNIDSYIRDLPALAEEGSECALCAEPVSQATYWSFWRGLPKTVKNQAVFCKTHKHASAQLQYTTEGYPPIDWSALPSRIKKHRMLLHRILCAETPSPHRARYEPLALTGKAAAVPSKRLDLSPNKQTVLASYALDDAVVYPGYYGPRGRRLIAENVMSLLRKEIKRCTDPVVQASGPATFVQAVLVPEVAVRLIMEDIECDWDAAEDVREATYEMGVLLNEEIDDCVDVGDAESEDERENDYVL